jgi:hypothetical protein
MKSLLNAILDGLTYKDIAGKRQPRTYAVITGVILILVLVLGSGAALERSAMMSEVQGTPETVQITVEPSATLEPTQSVEACPTDPADWSFLDAQPGSNLKRVEPVCVHDNLAKAAAWALAVREGYTRSEAAQALGFAELPVKRLGEITILTDTKGPLPMQVSFTPTHPDFSEWRVNSNGQPSIAYALRGCFRASTVVGNKAELWNQDYPVICTLSEDSYGSRIVFNLDGYTYTSESIPTRSFVLFGYLGNGQWAWLGTQKEPKIALETLGDFVGDAAASAGMHGETVWDASWLEQTFDLPMKPLPENWQTARDETERQAILDGLNAVMQESKP